MILMDLFQLHIVCDSSLGTKAINMMSIGAQKLLLSQSAIPVDFFRPPGWGFQHPKCKKKKEWLLTAVTAERKSMIHEGGFLQPCMCELPSASKGSGPLQQLPLSHTDWAQTATSMKK